MTRQPRTHHIPVHGSATTLAIDDWQPDGAPSRTALFLPGFGSIRTGLKATRFGRDLAAAGVRMLALDFEGHGESTGSFADMSVTRHLRDALATIEALEPREALVVIGSSMGGLVAARLAATLRARVAKLVLIAPAFGFRTRFESSLGAHALEQWEHTGVLRYTGEFFSAEIGFELMRDARTLDEDALARSIDAPTLVVHGTHDRTVPIECSEHAAKLWRAPLSFVRFEGSDHRLDRFLAPLSDAVVAFATAP